MSNNTKFYIYTAVVFIGMITYLQNEYDAFDPIDMPDIWSWNIIIPHFAVAFVITFGARWFLQYLQKSKEKKED